MRKGGYIRSSCSAAGNESQSCHRRPSGTSSGAGSGNRREIRTHFAGLAQFRWKTSTAVMLDELAALESFLFSS
jgi:hypothetical protein